MWWARLRLPCRTILNSPGLEGTRICLRPIWMSALRGLYEKPVKSEQRVQMYWRCGLGDGECRCEVQTTSHAWARLNLDQRGVMLQCRCLKMGWRHVEWNNMVGKEPVNLATNCKINWTIEIETDWSQCLLHLSFTQVLQVGVVKGILKWPSWRTREKQLQLLMQYFIGIDTSKLVTSPCLLVTTFCEVAEICDRTIKKKPCGK